MDTMIEGQVKACKELSDQVQALRSDTEGKLGFEAKLRKGMLDGLKEDLDEKIKSANAKAMEAMMLEERIQVQLQYVNCWSSWYAVSNSMTHSAMGDD